MARFNPHHDVGPVLAAAVEWKDRCLAADGSVLSPGHSIWTLDNIRALEGAFSADTNPGQGSFLDKLETQLAGQPSEVVQLAAELLWAMFLFPSNTGPASKRDGVRRVLSWRTDDVPTEDRLLADSILSGIGSTGTAFNTLRPKEFCYFITAVRDLKLANPAAREDILRDPWAFSDFLSKVAVDGTRQLSHILEFLLFPDDFERIASGGDKRKIIVAFSNEDPERIKQLDRTNRDRLLARIRRELTDERGNGEFDFYQDDMKSRWQDEQDGESTAVGPIISSSDIRLIQQSRQHQKYAQLSVDELAAYERVHKGLRDLGDIVVSVLGKGDYKCRLTSGYTLKSGVRGSLPKDLWFGVFANQNGDAFVGHPQLFMIASERGLEYGFAALTHPADFSDASIKTLVRNAAPNIVRLLPEAGSATAEKLDGQLGRSGRWTFRRKERLPPNTTDFPNLTAWLNHLHGMSDFHSAGGNISRYLVGAEIDHADLRSDVRQMAETFKPLMESVRASGRIAKQPVLLPQHRASDTFASIASGALSQFAEVRTAPFGTVGDLWESMDGLVSKLASFSAIRTRPHIFAKWSLGKGVWAKVPWIALMNRNVTTSTQDGLYVVFLVSEDLSVIYLTLNQGMTKLVRTHGEKTAVSILKERAAKYRSQVTELEDAGFELGDDIDLRTDNWRAKNYQPSTVAYVEFQTDNLPTDGSLANLLEPLLAAYDRLARVDDEDADNVIEDQIEPEAEAAPYDITEALDGLFIDQVDFENILEVWGRKKNLVLQGAPGVGKSFFARRLAYALMERKDDARIENIQFHQAYSYEDFIQGYKPTESGGFLLRDGIFYRFCLKAAADLGRRYVFIIDEINRGNLSKIFGELMLLIEPDKRSPEWGTQLAYAKDGDPKFHVPENVHIVGMMNTADRSLSMVDYALRRRFAFMTLEPAFASPKFRDFLSSASVTEGVIDRIKSRMASLNQAIAEDALNLGPGYRIGHSFFVPRDSVEDDEVWYRRVIDTEIAPLLSEYWFDAADKAQGWHVKLLAQS